uniref:Uncharacterized protein n=1 Tax=Sphaerodactylus townsendi TaxID=933632 RepID=A0ACB8E8Z6_9SAUR
MHPILSAPNHGALPSKGLPAKHASAGLSLAKKNRTAKELCRRARGHPEGAQHLAGSKPRPAPKTKSPHVANKKQLSWHSLGSSNRSLCPAYGMPGCRAAPPPPFPAQLGSISPSFPKSSLQSSNTLFPPRV